MRVVLLLLTIPALIYGWTRETWGRSDVTVKEDGSQKERLKYYYRKATFPICHRIDISASYTYGRQKEDGSTEFPTSGAFDRYDTNNYSKRRKVQYKWERGWVYEGLLVPREQWLHATFTFYCYKYRGGGKLLEVVKASEERSVFGIHGIMAYPFNNQISLSLAINNWNYNYLQVKCYRYPKYAAVASFQCNPKFGKYLRKNGIIIIDCGTSIPYGVTDLKCQSETIRPKTTEWYDRRRYHEVIWWPGLKEQATKPLQPFIRPPVYEDSDDNSNGVLTFPYVSLRHSIQDKMSYVITHDTRFSSFSFSNITGTFKVVPKTESCDADGDIRVNGTAVASQSSEYGGYPASNAINGKLGDFSHTKAKYDQWWMVRKDDWPGVGYVQIRFRGGYWIRQHKLTFLTANYKGSLIPSLSDSRWTRQFYKEAATPRKLIEYQFLPIIQLNHMAIYSQNLMDALELVEVTTEGSCVKTSEQEIKLPIGLDFIVTAKTMIERTGATSDNTYNRFSTMPMNASLVSTEICMTYRFEALRDYFGCTDSNSISKERMMECQEKDLPTLKELISCLDPDVPIDSIQEDMIREEKLNLQQIDPLNADWGWYN